MIPTSFSPGATVSAQDRSDVIDLVNRLNMAFDRRVDHDVAGEEHFASCRNRDMLRDKPRRGDRRCRRSSRLAPPRQQPWVRRSRG